MAPKGRLCASLLSSRRTAPGLRRVCEPPRGAFEARTARSGAAMQSACLCTPSGCAATPSASWTARHAPCTRHPDPPAPAPGGTWQQDHLCSSSPSTALQARARLQRQLGHKFQMTAQRGGRGKAAARRGARWRDRNRRGLGLLHWACSLDAKRDVVGPKNGARDAPVGSNARHVRLYAAE